MSVSAVFSYTCSVERSFTVININLLEILTKVSKNKFKFTSRTLKGITLCFIDKVRM